MRIKNLVLAAFIFSCTALHAQYSEFGLKAGINIATFTTDIDSWDPGNKIGFHGGIAMSFSGDDYFFFNPDLLFSLKGSKLTETENHSEFIPGYGLASVNTVRESNISLWYLELPLWFRYKFENGFYVNGGPYLGWRMGFTFDYEERITTTVPNQPSETKTTSSTSTDDQYWAAIDFGLKAGVGFRTEAGFDAGAHYSFSLSNLDTEPREDFYIHNSVIGVTLGYWFGR
jgi:hypothetical protein